MDFDPFWTKNPFAGKESRNPVLDFVVFRPNLVQESRNPFLDLVVFRSNLVQKSRNPGFLAGMSIWG